MKQMMSLLMSMFRQGANRRSIIVLVKFFVVLLTLVTVYSLTFHTLMEREGQHFSWITGFYWTLTVMSTLGFGDITFHTDVGRLFSILVLLSGMVFMLTLLPFTFIQFFYAPWMEAQSSSRVRRKLSAEKKGHVLLVHDDDVTRTLMKKLEQFHYPYVLLTPDVRTAITLNDEGIPTLVGELDDPQTYRNARVEQAALLAATSEDTVNANVVSTVRGLCSDIRIFATAKDEHSVDILYHAGCDTVVELGRSMGDSLARRIIGGDALAHIVGSFGSFCFAEATVLNTPLVGKTLKESRLREHVQVSILGLWQRGVFKPANPDTVIQKNSVLVLGGTREQLQGYDELFCIYNTSDAPIIIIGGGRVGRATGAALARRNIDYRIIEKLPERKKDNDHYVLGSAANLDVLNQAGIKESPAVVITPHDDDLNVYLTIYCRKLRPDIQIISRATTERNIDTLHRAGADFVMSYASMGANAVFNQLKRSDVIMLAEGLDLFKMPIPASMVGGTLASLNVRRETGCTLIAYRIGEETRANPGPNEPLPPDCEIVMIGSDEAEERFLKHFA